MHITKRRMWLELEINGLCLGFPLFLIIDGSVALAQNDPFHPDVFILFGLLIMGVLSLIMTGLTISRLRAHGWQGLSHYQQGLAIFYLIWLVIGSLTWLVSLGIIPIK